MSKSLLFFPLILISVFILACGPSELVVDASNNEALKSSIKKLKESIPSQEEKEVFEKAILRICMAIGVKNNDIELQKALKENLHGLNVKEIIKKANEIKDIGPFKTNELKVEDSQKVESKDAPIKFGEYYKTEIFHVKIAKVSVNKLGKFTSKNSYMSNDYKKEVHLVLYFDIENITDTKIFRVKDRIFQRDVVLKDNFNNEYKKVSIGYYTKEYFKVTEEYRPNSKGQLVFLFQEPIKKAEKLYFTFNMAQLEGEKKEITFEIPLKESDWNVDVLMGE